MRLPTQLRSTQLHRPAQLRRGAGHPTVSVSKDSVVANHITFPTEGDSEDVDSKPAGKLFAEELAPLGLSQEDVNGQDSQREKSKALLEDSSAEIPPFTAPPPVRQRKLSTKPKRRDTSRGRTRSSSAPAAPETPAVALPPTPPPAGLLLITRKRSTQRRRPTCSDLFDGMPRSPLSKTDQGFGFVCASYHCEIPGCSFSASSMEHVRHHTQTVCHSRFAQIRSTTSCDETETF